MPSCILSLSLTVIYWLFQENGEVNSEEFDFATPISRPRQETEGESEEKSEARPNKGLF